MTVTETAPTIAPTDRARLVHYFCPACAPEVGFCGTPLTGNETEDDADCVVCEEFFQAWVPICGKCRWDWRFPRPETN